MERIKFTKQVIIYAIMYFAIMDIYYYFNGFYKGIYNSCFSALIGGQMFAITHSYYKFILIGLLLDLIIHFKVIKFIRKVAIV